jgi:DNA-binding SARP family transcriptional activator
MAMLTIQLFGRLAINIDGVPVHTLESRKAQELLAFLLLHRDRPHTREALATLFWADASPAKGRKYLRQALWRVHNVVGQSPTCPLVLTDGEWVTLNPQADVWLDVAVFERICHGLKADADVPLSTPDAQRLESAVALYQGELLDSCYEEWCLFERERLQGLYVDALDTLVDHALRTGAYAAGIQNAHRLLAIDPARERTHRRLMKLYWLSGDRTGAMRQYQRCTTVLARELGVVPADATRALFEQISASDPGAAEMPAIPADATAGGTSPSLIAQTTLHQLLTFRSLLTSVQSQIQADITRLEQLISRQWGERG